ncbi:MAG TPA: L,D-transpeptidase [Blastocatellia bacterium]
MFDYRTHKAQRFCSVAILTVAVLLPWPVGANATAGQSQLQPVPPGVPTDTRIVVNIPAFRMDLFSAGTLTKSYKVAIGYPEFPLPIGLRTAGTIIFSPSWTPPHSPWVEKSYKVRPGERIPPGSRLNPLGPIKVPIGLPALIHGGKHLSQIGTFGSHGCVGLTDEEVNDFAKRLAQMGGSQLTDQEIAEYEKNKTETKPFKLANPVPVELRYDTITVENAQLCIYRDVYARGTNTPENVRNVLLSYGINPDQWTDAQRAVVLQALSQMAKDASGNPVQDTSGAVLKRVANIKARAKRVVVTRVIRGPKQETVPIAALQGKGYPAPVDLDSGAGVVRPPAKTSRRRRR